MLQNLSCMIAVALLGAGCSQQSTGTVEGRVLVDGQPYGGFEVSFSSVRDGSGALGASKADGTYRLMHGRRNYDIPVGEYKVTLTPTSFVDNVPMPKVKLPESYANPRETMLIKTVQGGRNQIDIEVQSKK